MTQEFKEVIKFKIDKNSIFIKLWKYFASFTVLILMILWIFQILFLSKFYEPMKIRQVTSSGNYLRSEFKSKDFEDKLLHYVTSKGFEVKVIDSEGKSLYPLSVFELIENPKLKHEDFDRYFGTLERENLRYKVYTVYKKNSEPQIVYAGYLGISNGEPLYLYISSILKPVDATIDILTNILVIISILSLILGVIVSYFVSRRLSKPLVRMSNTAKKLGKGDYNVEFKKGDYTEIDNLSDTLNYATNELTKTIEMRKDLIANVSHDLKTPLTVIKSYGEMIRDISGNNEKLRNEHINTIISEADNLTDLVNDLLDLSKIESDLEQIKKIKFNLADVAEDVIKRFDYLKNNQNYIIDLNVKGNTYILGDKSKIKQVIYNLINNAINYSKYKKDDGKNNIILINIFENKDNVEFHCIDHGIGIKKEDLAGIWERFYRVRNNHSRPEVGTGLGLYIVKSILSLHDFKFGVNSIINEGSDFYFIAKSEK